MSRRDGSGMPLSLSGVRTVLGVFACLFVVSACGGGGGSGGSSAEASGGGTTPAPDLTFTSSAAQVTSGQSVTLTWSATNATSCTASGGWTGTKATSGTQSVGPLSANASYDLSCSDGTRSVEKNVSVTVNPAASTPAPTVSLQASSTQVSSGDQVTLSWSSTNATQCTASGAWSGTKPTSGMATVGPLAAASLFMLSCSGSGGSTQSSVNVDIAQAGQGQLSGAVDSSLVDAAGVAQVYVFSGAVTPHDRTGGSNDPVAVASVEQGENACTFQYSLPTLSPGTYTVALTSQAQSDRPTAADNITFSRTANVTVTASPATQNFDASRIITVGPGKTYATIAAAADHVASGDVIQVTAGTYVDDVVVWRTNNVVIRGVGGRAHVKGNRVIGFSSGDDRENGKGLWVVEASGIRVENMEFSNAKVTDENGAGIRNDGGRNLTICNSSFHENENGFLGTALGTLTIEYSTFSRNGIGDGYTHNVYVADGGSNGDKLVFRYNDSNNVSIGHTLKTRARENYILYNRLVDETAGTSSYNIDVPNGGIAYVVGNVIQQGPDTDNSIILAYGAEGLASGRTHSLYIANNTFVNDRGSGTFVSANSGVGEFRSVNNLYVGGGTSFQGKQPQATTDLSTSSPAFKDRAAFDYHLVAGSPAIDAGSDPGTAAGFSLQPRFQVVAGGRREARASAGGIDIGAYEFQP